VEWEKHIEKLEGHPPPDDAVRRWYRDLPPEQLLRAKGEAENSLKAYASEVWDEFRSSEREAVREEIVVQEIRLSRRFWPQFGIGVAAGVVSALMFALLLLALVFIVVRDPSPIGLGRAIFGGSEEGVAT
jgi:hypothetical protein